MQRILQFLIDFLSKFIKPDYPEDDKISPTLAAFCAFAIAQKPYSVFWNHDKDSRYIKAADVKVFLKTSKGVKSWVLKREIKLESGITAEHSIEFACNKANDDLIAETMNTLAQQADDVLLNLLKVSGEVK
jgi:hypothetical protein